MRNISSLNVSGGVLFRRRRNSLRRGPVVDKADNDEEAAAALELTRGHGTLVPGVSEALQVAGLGVDEEEGGGERERGGRRCPTVILLLLKYLAAKDGMGGWKSRKSLGGGYLPGSCMTRMTPPPLCAMFSLQL